LNAVPFLVPGMKQAGAALVTDARNVLKSVLDQVINNADCTVLTSRDSDVI